MTWIAISFAAYGLGGLVAVRLITRNMIFARNSTSRSATTSPNASVALDARSSTTTAAGRPLSRRGILPRAPRWKCRSCRRPLDRIRTELVCEACE